MPKSFSAELGAWKASVERRLDNLASGNRLDHASLDGTTLYLKGDGELGRIGRQPDGSNGVHVVKVQPPPQLTAPILTVGEQAGTCLVEWDGGTFDGRRMPLIHGHAEIWAEMVGEDWSPTVAPGDTAKRVGTIRDRTGGEVVVALPQAGTWAVWLRAMGADRETAGPWSPVSQVDITPLVDTEAIEAELEDARDRLAQAEQDLAAGMADRVAEIEYLREVRIPALQGALTTGLDDVYRDAQAYAEAQADDAVNRAAADAQSEYDRLQEIAERALSRAGDNVLEDPSFETDYWLDTLFLGTFDVATSTLARTGDQAMAITRATSATSGTNMTFDTVDVEPDDSWRFSIWYRTVDGDTADLDQGVGTRLRIRDGGNNILAASTVFEPGEEYSRAVVTFTVPSEGVSSLRPTLVVAHTQGTLIVDDVSFQEVGAAAEALRLAEVARQQAEAAHVAAGNAVDVAANAYDAASAKNTIHWSLSAPSGTADSTDDVWWQYELRNGRRVVVGQWFWDNGVWRETEIAEEWLPLVNIGTGTYGTMTGDRLEAHTVRTNHLLVGPQNVITDQSFESLTDGGNLTWTTPIEGAWHTATVAWSDRPVLRLAGEWLESGNLSAWYGGTTSSAAAIPCLPGEAYKLRFQVARYSGWSSSDDYRVQVRWVSADGATISWDAYQFGDGVNQQWHTVEVEAPDGAARFAFRFYKSGTVGGARGVTNVSLEKMTDSSLIVRGAVKSHSVDTEEFFAAQAVIEKIWTDIVRSRLIESEGIITEDMIATGAITTPKLTVTEEMVGEVARLLRIEAGSLASNDIEAMRIVSSLIEATTYLIHNADGDVSVRLDGLDNYIAGRLHAGMSGQAGISLDYHQAEIPDDWEDEDDEDSEGGTSSYVTPEAEFHSSHTHELQPKIFVNADGALAIDPGKFAGQTRRLLQVFRGVRTQRVESVRYQVQTSNANYPGGLMRDGDRMRIYGRAPDWSHPWGTFTVGQLGPYNPSTGSYRGSIGFSAPAETGTRMPTTSGRMSQGSVQDWRSCTATVGGVTASGFYFSLVSESTSTNMWLIYNAIWQ